MTFDDAKCILQRVDENRLRDSRKTCSLGVEPANVLLAALRSRQGASFEIISRYRKGEFALLISNTVLSEYDEVLKREGPSLGVTATTVDRFLDALCAGAESFPTSSFWKPSLPDADGEAFAQLALEAKVGYLVTFNQRHFPADRLPACEWCRRKSFFTSSNPSSHDHPGQQPRLPHPSGG